MSKLRGENLEKFAKKLSSGQKVLQHFPISLEIPHVQVIVQILSKGKPVLRPVSCTSLIKKHIHPLRPFSLTN